MKAFTPGFLSPPSGYSPSSSRLTFPPCSFTPALWKVKVSLGKPRVPRAVAGVSCLTSGFLRSGSGCASPWGCGRRQRGVLGCLQDPRSQGAAVSARVLLHPDLPRVPEGLELSPQLQGLSLGFLRGWSCHPSFRGSPQGS